MVPVVYEKVDGVAFITLNRPEKLNALTPEMIVRLADAWTDVAADDGVRVVLLTGVGEKAFSAGADLGELVPLLTRDRPPQDEWDERLVANRGLLNTALLRSTDFFKPVVAAVNGAAIAGGTELLMGTDIRIASSHATFGLTEVRRGLVPGGGSLSRLARQVPWSAAMEIILLGEPISAAHAFRVGLVNRVVPAEALQATARDFAHRIALGGPLALTKAKEAVVRSSGLSLAEAFEVEDACSRVVEGSEDAREGPRAFMERREPRFLGR